MNSDWRPPSKTSRCYGNVVLSTSSPKPKRPKDQAVHSPRGPNPKWPKAQEWPKARVARAWSSRVPGPKSLGHSGPFWTIHFPQIIAIFDDFFGGLLHIWHSPLRGWVRPLIQAVLIMVSLYLSCWWIIYQWLNVCGIYLCFFIENFKDFWWNRICLIGLGRVHFSLLMSSFGFFNFTQMVLARGKIK